MCPTPAETSRGTGSGALAEEGGSVLLNVKDLHSSIPDLTVGRLRPSASSVLRQDWQLRSSGSGI